MKAKQKSGDVVRILGWMALSLCIIFLLGSSCALYSDTLIAAWKPVSACCALALISAFIYGHKWQRITHCDFAPLNFGLHAVVTFTILIFAFFSVNYFFSDTDDKHIEKVSIERRYRETHYHTKRVGRRVSGRGAPYYVYYVEVRFNDGRVKPMQVAKSRYDRLHSGDSIPLEIETGYLGVPVIRTKLLINPKK